MTNLGPDTSGGVPAIGILSLGDLGDVEHNWSNVLDGRRDLKSDAGSGLDVEDTSSWSSGFFIAGHGGIADVGQTLVRPLVCGSSNELPFLGDGSVSHELWEGV